MEGSISFTSRLKPRITEMKKKTPIRILLLLFISIMFDSLVTNVSLSSKLFFLNRIAFHFPNTAHFIQFWTGQFNGFTFDMDALDCTQIFLSISMRFLVFSPIFRHTIFKSNETDSNFRVYLCLLMMCYVCLSLQPGACWNMMCVTYENFVWGRVP